MLRMYIVQVAVSLLLSFCVGAFCSGCKERIGGDGNGGSLPSGEWAGWKPERKIMEYGREDLSAYLGGAASYFLGYDFRRLWVRPYHNSANETLTAELYDLSSAEEAYGVFSRDWHGEALQIVGAEALYAQGALKLRKGKYYLWLLASAPNDRYREDLVALAEAVARQLPGGLTTPSLVQKLPKEGLRKDSIFYFHTKSCLDSKVSLGRENLLHLSRKTSAVVASYDLPEGQADLLLVEYPEGAAAEAFSSFRAGYFRKASLIEDSPGFLLAETKSAVHEGMALVGRLLAVVLNSESEQGCRHLLESLENVGR